MPSEGAPRFGDVAHLGHVELLTPKPDESLAFFTSIVGLHETARAGDSVYFLYCYEPGGNRFEIGSGGYLILDPEWKPVVWTEEERAYGQAWGLKTASTFHTHGTPPVPDSTSE